MYIDYEVLRDNASKMTLEPPAALDFLTRLWYIKPNSQANEFELKLFFCNDKELSPMDRPTKVESQKSILEILRQKKVAAGLAVGLGLAAFTGCAANSNDGEPAPTPTSTAIETEAPVVPPEAQEFVDYYSDRFPDALATYYAVTAYEQESGGTVLTIADWYTEDYDFDSLPFQEGEMSPLGFPGLAFDFSQEIQSEETFSEFFNDSAAPVLERVTNLIAKNPTGPQIAVIRDEFKKYSGMGNPHADTLIDTLADFVYTHGSNANYTILPSTPDYSASQQENTVLLGHPDIDAVDEDENITAFFGTLDLSFGIESYDNENTSTYSVATLENLHLSVGKTGTSDPNNRGFVGIGIK